MKILTALVALSCLLLFSCQKERSADRTDSGNGTASGELLTKTIAKTSTDSLVSVYTYDADKKLIGLKITGTDQGADASREFKYYRNASGIITHYSATSPDLVANGIDSLLTIIHYDNATSRYTSYVLNINILGYVQLDSVVYEYDGSGRITGERLYESPSGAGNDYYYSGKVNYTYTNGNISQLDLYDYDQSGAETFSGTSKYQFDSKINPAQFGNEGIILGHPEWASANNVTNGQLSDSNGPVDNQTVTITYTYNNDKPATSVTSLIPDNTTTNTSFYYQ